MARLGNLNLWTSIVVLVVFLSLFGLVFPEQSAAMLETIERVARFVVAALPSVQG